MHAIPNAAATPIVSVSSATGSIHAMLLIGDDVFGESDGLTDIPIKVSFESVTGQSDGDRPQERRTIEELLVAPTRGEARGAGGHRLTSVNFKTVFDREEMAALGNGGLSMRVSSSSSPERAVVGYLAPRYSCDLFDSVLAGDDDDESDENVGGGSIQEGNDDAESDDVPLHGEEDEINQRDTADAEEKASGMAWMFMKKDGEIEYHVRYVYPCLTCSCKDCIPYARNMRQGLSHMEFFFLRLDSIPPSEQIKSIHVDNGRKSRRLLKIVADLLPDPEGVSGRSVSDGAGISGTIRLSASDIEDLYKADLYINVATNTDERLLRGRIMPQVSNP